ncbi:hypothetical protein HC891_05640 [Candidatus Gracilibacteria bacterium]|nr:hypothetical protein [Candidatus Gracilibacteria bacterium]
MTTSAGEKLLHFQAQGRTLVPGWHRLPGAIAERARRAAYRHHRAAVVRERAQRHATQNQG